MARRLIITTRLSFLLLFLLLVIIFPTSSCAWAEDNGGRDSRLAPARAARGVRGAARARALDGAATEDQQANGAVPRSPAATGGAIPKPGHAVRDGCPPMITPPPSLSRRQDNQGQIQALSDQLQQLSQQSRSVSQASQQVSQSSQQLSQSLQQATQRLSQTEQQLASAQSRQSSAESASRSATQAAADASRSADEASRSADRAVSSAASSASAAIAANMASATRGVGASVASALALASQSASVIMNSAASMVQQAQADVTAARNAANSQVQQAQGAALSVTQAALAVVGGIVASSLLTIVAFVLILRYRRKKRRMTRLGKISNIGYPAAAGTEYKPADYEESNYSNDNDMPSPPANNGFSVDVKEPLPAVVLGRNGSTLSRRSSGGAPKGVGYATSYYGPTPIGVGAGNTVTAGVGGGGGGGGLPFQLRSPPRGKFTLFPKSRDEFNSPRGAGASLSSSTMNGEMSPEQQQRASKTSFPSLDTWLRVGTTVSPFATLQKSNILSSSPEQQRQQVDDEKKRSLGEWPIKTTNK
ncbi:hypothetical protein B0T17DRAFT_502584 [Bombardia bombarda]|uniref:Uncharacterized protein n=1 Tax=Bombardia bombarda TaxID=252184 RepID=A0AA39XJU3_9PEZI|nr:hypothetical protein B0T17DRAFT_502584 [Bombardia bombarda]